MHVRLADTINTCAKVGVILYLLIMFIAYKNEKIIDLMGNVVTHPERKYWSCSHYALCTRSISVGPGIRLQNKTTEEELLYTNFM